MVLVVLSSVGSWQEPVVLVVPVAVVHLEVAPGSCTWKLLVCTVVGGTVVLSSVGSWQLAPGNCTWKLLGCAPPSTRTGPPGSAPGSCPPRSCAPPSTRRTGPPGSALGRTGPPGSAPGRTGPPECGVGGR